MEKLNKRYDPNYKQVSGHVPSELARQFGIYCAAKGVTKSEALEKAIKLLLEEEENETPPSPKPKRSRSQEESDEDEQG